METCHVNVDQIWKVWHLCSDSYLRYGIRLSFPKHTDPTKTYQWRYCRSLAEKFEGWNFDDVTSGRFIDLAVKHAKTIGVLRKGLAVMHQGNMVELVYKQLQEEATQDDQSIDSLKHTKIWFDAQIGDNDPIAVLLDRQHADSFCNIVIWNQANKLPPLYISLSKSCCKALARLKDEDERNLLPSVIDLYRLRSGFTEDTNCLKHARSIFGRDWRELCH